MSQFERPRLKQIAGSLIAILIGWFSGLFVFVSFALYSGMLNQQEIGLGIFGLSMVFLYMGAYVLPVWLVVFLPLYTLLPADSPLWRPALCTGLGAVAGAVIISVFPVARWNSPEWIPYFIMAAVVGGVSCLVASLTAHHFRGTSGSNQSLEPTAGRRDAQILIL